MKLYLFAIGGTGARVVRSLTMMLASGIDGLDSSVEIVPVIIDYDLSNADKTRTINLLQNYTAIHNSLYPAKGVVYNDNFFMTTLTPLKNVGIQDGAQIHDDFQIYFGPQGQNKTFAQYLDLQAMQTNPALKTTCDLLESLYDDSDKEDKNTELNLDLTVGFKGNPNIGNVVFHDLRSTPELQQFFSTFDPINDKVFIVSSIFGGTGSSGFPELVKAIRTTSRGNIAAQAKIGACVVLPYFKLQNPAGPAAIDAESFNAKAVSALSYYSNNINNDVNSMYYVADENTGLYDYSEGSTSQENRAHVVEFVAASSIVHFLLDDTVAPNNHNAFEFGIKDDCAADEIKYNDFYDQTHSQILDKLSVLVIASKYYKDVICGERAKISNRVAFYSKFNLANKIHKGVHQHIDQFINSDGIDKEENPTTGRWGLYPWLCELRKQSHKMHLYNLEKEKDLNTIIVGKPASRRNIFTSAPLTDDNFAALMDKECQKSNSVDDQEFFKVLRTVSEICFKKID